MKKVAKETWSPANAEEVVKALSEFVNCHSHHDYEQVISLMSREHRTLQQQMTRICVMWLEHLSTLEEHGYDLRNEGSVKLAKQLLSGVESSDLYLPLI